jgi:hypothetical protein
VTRFLRALLWLLEALEADRAAERARRDSTVADLRRRNAEQQRIIENSHANNAALRQEIFRLQRARRDP